jgi:hypothetical protein
MAFVCCVNAMLYDGEGCSEGVDEEICYDADAAGENIMPPLPQAFYVEIGPAVYCVNSWVEYLFLRFLGLRPEIAEQFFNQHAEDIGKIERVCPLPNLAKIEHACQTSSGRCSVLRWLYFTLTGRHSNRGKCS